ncbi:DNA gyrase C-terminal beta-propeller domain-containing protein, partial [Corynebacterium sanguinis]
SGGYGKRTAIGEYATQGRGGLGVMTFKYTPKRGKLIGALAVEEEDQIFAITSAGGVIRTEVAQIRPSSRATMGVRLVDLAEDVELLAIDKNVEDEGEEEATAVAKGEKTLAEAQEVTSSASPVNVNSVETDPVGPTHDYEDEE